MSKMDMQRVRGATQTGIQLDKGKKDTSFTFSVSLLNCIFSMHY